MDLTPRVAIVIERMTGVRYHSGHVWKILGALNWTVQKPELQVKKRNPLQVHYWRTVRWPELKKAVRERAWIFFQETKPDSPCNPRFARPGRREGKRRS
jgi:hypothetical protein